MGFDWMKASEEGMCAPRANEELRVTKPRNIRIVPMPFHSLKMKQRKRAKMEMEIDINSGKTNRARHAFEHIKLI